MGRYHAILFDMDGTLLDTLTDMQDAVNHVLAAHGLPLRTLEEVRRFVGNGAGPLIHRARRRISSGAEGAGGVPGLLSGPQLHPHLPLSGHPGAAGAAASAGLKLAVVSNKPDETTRTLAARFFPGVTALGQRDGIPSKPAPEMVWSAMEQLGADARHALYVGDSEVDVEMARRAGLPLAAVAWGFRGRALLEQAGARCIVDTVPELLAVATE
ncbi:MAG: HAD family hydrolase [Oscillospiraceae bacterium]